MKYSIKEVHISTIKVGDTVEHNGELKTVDRESMGREPLMGPTLWGDSYMMGHKPVKKAIIHRAMPYIGE